MEFERVQCVIGLGTSITNHDAGADEWRSRKISVAPNHQALPSIQRFLTSLVREVDRDGPIIPEESQVMSTLVNPATRSRVRSSGTS
jgi:hypothetical protein